MCIVVLCEAKDITDVITTLDDPKYRFLFHRFRDWVFNRIGKTGLRTSGRFLQEKFSDKRPFPCDIRHSRSKDIPKSVHKLRPGIWLFNKCWKLSRDILKILFNHLGDFDVIAAIGDSLTAATGAMATKYMELSMENRGLAWCIGGQWNWRNSTTLPNILKEFNPKVCAPILLMLTFWLKIFRGTNNKQ